MSDFYFETNDFIPKQYKKDPVTIRMGLEKIEKIDRMAAEFNISRNELINQYVDYALKHMPAVFEK
ncbi:MAG: ribbon-helix-helix domain-containing protein [Clostridiales bacterium]|nr:ribbon-helix-helix domain-containing protein [Clostridiales bacterium]